MREFVGFVAHPRMSLNKDGRTPMFSAELVVLTDDVTYYKGDTMLHSEVSAKLEAMHCSISREGIRSAIEALHELDIYLQELENRVCIDPPSTADEIEMDEDTGC